MAAVSKLVATLGILEIDNRSGIVENSRLAVILVSRSLSSATLRSVMSMIVPM